MRTKLVYALFLVGLAGCARDDMEDLRAFMQQAGLDAPAPTEPLPQVKMVERFTYDAQGLIDPFIPRNTALAHTGDGSQLDLKRPKEPLEHFPIDSLRLVGTLMREGRLHALVQAPDNTVHLVRHGDRIGQNFGVITAITETNIEIRETVADGVGGWTHNTVTLQMP